jgi:hypothetical protein
LEEAQKAIRALHSRVESGQKDAWEGLANVSLDVKRSMLQALNTDATLGGSIRRKLEETLRGELREHKRIKEKPKGDFVKLLITHRGWNAAEVRKILREPEVCKAHPNPTAAERIWVCERNVPPIGSWLLNYTAMENEELRLDKRVELDTWDREEEGKATEDQKVCWDCGCFRMVTEAARDDVWKGHLCTSEVRKFRSPLVRALLLKGHAFKFEQGEETLLSELNRGLEGYINYKVR